MSDIVYSSHGWPMLAPGARLNQTDDYTRELAAKLETSDAQAAADSAAAAAAAAASIGPRAAGVHNVTMNANASGTTLTFPASRFSSPPHVVATITTDNAASYAATVIVHTITAIQCSIRIQLAPGNNGGGAVVGVRWIAIQLP